MKQNRANSILTLNTKCKAVSLQVKWADVRASIFPES